MRSNRMKKWLVISTVVAVSILIGLFIKLAIDNMYFQPHGYLKIVSVPENISVSYDDKSRTMVSGETKAIPIGSYDIRFSAEGFSEYIVSVDVKDNETKQIGVQLTPETNEAKDEHSDSKYDRNKEFDTSYRMDQETAKIEANNPIINQLPILSRDYTIEQCEAYREDTIKRGNIGICIQIIEPEKYREALKEITSLDSDIDKYDILFNDEYTYPTKSERDAGKTFTLIEPYDYGHSD